MNLRLRDWIRPQFQATHWGHSDHDIRLRNQIFPKQDEKTWSKEMNSFIRKHFKVDRTTPALFIDSHYRKKDPQEKAAFQTYCNLLLDMVLTIANTSHYDFKDVEAVRSELGRLKARASILAANNSALDAYLYKLTKENAELRYLKYKNRIWIEEHNYTTFDVIVATVAGLGIGGTCTTQ